MFLENTITSDPIEQSIRKEVCQLIDTIRQVDNELQARINFRNSTPSNLTHFIRFLEGNILAYKSKKKELENELKIKEEQLKKYDGH
jgi:hypothetical protein